jgi:hypothetical protein
VVEPKIPLPFNRSLARVEAHGLRTHIVRFLDARAVSPFVAGAICPALLLRPLWSVFTALFALPLFRIEQQQIPTERAHEETLGVVNRALQCAPSDEPMAAALHRY